LEKLRDRAVEEIFEWLGVAAVPPQMWVALKQESDPAESTIKFIRSTGCDPDKIRQQDREELARFHRAIDAVLAWGRVPRKATIDEIRRVQTVLFFGDPDEVLHFLKNAEAIAGIIATYDGLPGKKHFARHETLVREVRTYWADPLDWQDDKRDSAVAASEELARTERTVTTVVSKMRSILDDVSSVVGALPDDDDNVALMRAAELKLAEIDQNLFVTGDEDPMILLDRLNGILDLLEEAYDNISGTFHKDDDFDSAAAASKDYDRRVIDAFRFFGLDPDDPPSQEKARTVFYKKMMANHPDRFPDDPDAGARTATVNVQWEILKTWYAKR
jgi:hypothetical protein